MANRVTQTPTEVLDQKTDPNVRATQVNAEAAVISAVRAARTTQFNAEVLRPNVAATATPYSQAVMVG